MKFKKKSIAVFALCWIVGITGGYMIGVESSVLNESVEYNYYFSDYPHSSTVQSIDKSKELKAEEENENKSFLKSLLKKLNVFELPKRILNKTSPKACNSELDENKKCEDLV